MQRNSLLIIAVHFWKNSFKSKTIYLLMFMVALMLLFAVVSGGANYRNQNQTRKEYQKKVRQSWENNPDKHPHRMAHYGSFAFRNKHKLSMFDLGMESYTGNAVFLEAHKQNSINFSEASFSTGLLRFGEVSIAMLLQVIFPLIVFFIGYGALAEERENGRLKVLLTQGATWRDLLLGKSLGLTGVIMVFFIPVITVLGFMLFFDPSQPVTGDELLRLLGIIICYFLFFQILIFITIVVSARSKRSKDALIKLLGAWLFFFILVPKTSQALGSYFYPSPSRIGFEAQIEKDLIETGDSHDPNDPYYKALKDSLLTTYRVDSVEKLPFNYSGFIMKEGEKMSASIYNIHLQELLNTYESQNRVGHFVAVLNPYMAVRNISMAFCGTDFNSYISFQKQAENYRYQMAQEMNNLQIRLMARKIGQKESPKTISKAYWKNFPDFKYSFPKFQAIIEYELLSIVSIGMWSICLLLVITLLSTKAI